MHLLNRYFSAYHQLFRNTVQAQVKHINISLQIYKCAVYKMLSPMIIIFTTFLTLFIHFEFKKKHAIQMYWLSYFSFSTFNKTKRGFQILGTLNCRLKWNILVVFFRLWSQTSRWRWWSLWRPYSPTSGGCRLLNLTNSRRRTSCPCWINSFCRSQSVPFLQSVTYVI